jgi:hypothetical protein
VSQVRILPGALIAAGQMPFPADFVALGELGVATSPKEPVTVLPKQGGHRSDFAP